MVGLADFAAVKCVDKQNFPGPGSYSPRREDGPRISISNRYASRTERSVTTTTEIGPGKYDVRGTIGEGPKYSFAAKPQGEGTSSGTTSPNQSPRKGGGTPRKGDSGSSAIPPLPKQYSMATCPTSPRFSLYGRQEVKSADLASIPGPGQYTLGSTFSKNGKTLSGRQEIERGDAAELPGPGAYDVARFGDKIAVPKPPFIPHTTAMVHTEIPGPGSYEVHGTIEERVSPRRNRISTEPLFGSRAYPPEGRSAAPGPGAYDQETYTLKETLGMHKGVTMGRRNNPSGELDSIYPKPGPGEYVIPDGFGDTKKGFTLHSRREDPPPKLVVPGPGQYHPGGTVVEELMKSHQGARFNGGRAFHKGGDAKAPRLEDKPGPGAYEPTTTILSPRVKGFTFNSRGEGKHDNPFVDWAAAPGPGTYNPKQIHTEKAGPGFTFYKGSF